MDLSRQFRSTALILFVIATLVTSSSSRFHGRRHKRQNGAHMYLPESFIVPGGEGDAEEWTEWSSPSECSRSCGGGVSFQTRECLRTAPNGALLCKGGNRKYFSCNTQDCPENELDFRSQQCSRFNSVPFDGVRYEWVPYTNAPNPCELNCMPIGERFYYRQKAKVIDGTRCNDKELDVCVDGICEPVGCDMMLGSNAKEDKCRKCAGDGSSCKTISDIFNSNNLAPGYNDILLIPAGATNIRVQEVAPSNNYLACRNLTGHYYLNGNWRIDFPRPMFYAGSWWHYQRKPTGFAAPDQLTCSGPTTEAIYIVMLIQDRNVGIQYEYSIPESVSKRTPDSYSWTHMEFGPCNASCGGGTQTRTVTCNNRITLEEVDPNLCEAHSKPDDAQECGLEECAPHWVEGMWGKCSKSCGLDGMQTRTVTCERVSPSGEATVAEDAACLKLVGEKPAETQECNRDVNNCPKYHIGPWTPCDKLCGEGKQSRKVTCYIEENGRKKVLKDDKCSEEKPETQQTCMLTPCEGVDWILSEWSGCKACGQTMETRTAICSSKAGKIYADEFCAPEVPTLKRSCKSTRCQVQWFSSEWSKCSASCGIGLQSRIVICGEFDGVTVTPAKDDTKCDTTKKPQSEQECQAEVAECPGQWFTGPWGECNKLCGGGERTREVLCLANGTRVSTCEESTIETFSEKCNLNACTEDETIPVDSTSKPIDDEEESGEECDEDYDEDDFGVELITTVKVKDDFKVSEGIDLDGASTTLSSLISDDLMLSDSPGPDYSDTMASESSTDISETTVEGSGEETESTDISSVGVTEGSGDETEVSTFDLTTEVSSSTATDLDKSTDISSLSTEAFTTSSSVSDDITSTEVSPSTDGISSAATSEETESPETTEATGSTIFSSSQSTDISTTTEASTESSSYFTTTPDETTDSSESTTLSSIGTSDSTTDVSTETTLSSQTETTETTESPPTTETTSESSTETTADVSTESTESSTQDSESTTFDYSSTTDLLDSTTTSITESSTILDSSDSTLSSSDETTETTASTFTDSTDVTATTESILTDDSTESTTDMSTVFSTESSTETSSEASTETSTESSTEYSTVSQTDSSADSLTDTTTDASTVDSSTISTESSDDISTTVSSSESDETTSGTSIFSSTDATTDADSSYGTTESESTESTTITEEETTVDIWSTAGTEVTEEDVEKTTPNSLEAAILKETKVPRKCKVRKSKKTKCSTTKFGCCPDKRTAAKGPFDEGCPVARTCAETEFGCCLDGVSPAEGSHNKGCPKSQCAESLFGCCPDNFTPAEGDDNEGCPEPTTLPPTTTEMFTEASETTEVSGETETTEDISGSTELTTMMPETTEAPSPAVDTVESCAFAEFGCCPDGKTAAEGENFKGCKAVVDEKDCTKSIYGCCDDRLTSATGPDGQGCAPCTKEPFGCCRDGQTPAHGHLGEGCCLNTVYGCCPDNINAARGPNFEDCDCKYTPYGCCEDNKSAARGPNNEGCGCAHSPFGCCPDKLTAATGPKFAGCPCQSMQFGCCPDGLTFAQGPHHYGCHCTQTEFKCCTDEKTPAKGPNYEGCTCVESKFGCCPDGVAAAQGDKFEGCENVKESPQRACGLPKETGPCSNFTIKYFFDTSYGACARFWYGGCEGNGNKFETEGDCKSTCQDYKGKDTCLLPKSSGPCTGFHKKWYFDSDRNRCEEFNYGGCYGTSNRFDSKEECQSLCAINESLPPCDQPMDQGPCEGNYERWFYDNETDICRPFSYGGCKGNKNNYATEHACNYHCRQPGVHKELCALPKQTGECSDRHARWHFSETEQKCMPFYYTGCGGNKNNFQSLESCEDHCPKKIAMDVCEIPAEVGECQNYTAKWYFDTKDVRCRQFYYGGCGGNGNKFDSEDDCLQRCEKKPEPEQTPEPQPERRPEPEREPAPDNVIDHGDDEKCFMQPEQGGCNEFTTRWFYNSNEGLCDEFKYSGCGGNRNNFATEEDCENSCSHVHRTCSLPPIRGSCSENITRWHYDERASRCYEFDFSGCKGNRNNFFSETECMDYCRNDHPEGEVKKEPAPSETYSLCQLPMNVGTCNNRTLSWFFNAESGSCEAFTYNGCDGNANRFESREQCDRQCGDFRGVDVCNEPLDSGTCTDWVTRYFYNKNSRSCEAFSYGGCDGSGNRFADRAECESVCIVGQEPNTQDNREICKLPVNTGRCVEQNLSERRWFYDDDRGTCTPFIYAGCSGNQNNFRSLESCFNYCANFSGSVANVSNEIEPSNCESFEEQCRQMRCPFGTKTTSGEDGCKRCECENPCAGYNCPEGRQCAVDVASETSDGNRFVPICRDTNKPGECPQLSTNSSRCVRECYTDADCREDNKCCADDCGHVCVRPTQPTIHTTRPTTPTPAVIYPGEVQAGLEPKHPREVDVSVSVGGVAVLRCFATGNPPPTISWSRKNILIDTNQGRYVLTSTGDLTIVQVRQTDSGSYICVATNGLGAPVQRELQLNVTAPRNITAYIHGPRNHTQIVTLNKPAVVRCPAGGYPAPYVSWWRAKKRLGLTSTRFDTTREHSLVFRQIKLSDLGPYTCEAYSGHGRPVSMKVILKAVGPVHATRPEEEPFLRYILSPSSAPTTPKPSYPYRPTRPHVRPPPPIVVDTRVLGEETLHPKVTPKRVSAKAVLIREPSNSFTLGSAVVLNCEVDGYPTPNVTWSKDSLPLTATDRIQITANPHRLVINDATLDDTGVYGCTARNSFSWNTSEEKVLIESSIYVDPDCIDNPYFANCALIVRGKYCKNHYYAKFCCRSCTLAGQLAGAHPNAV